ncbi:MDR family MFS transporter [Candidatus Amarolinea aalborgensis]|uniref:MDR family MFS transporter n=1 Tax=Candidatus Amarolinea aalborgensis TaxID=2249329 RepID=UPI003BFA30AD
MLRNLIRSFQEFPLKFRILIITVIIDRLGGTILFPFFTLYVTRRFQVGMTEAGILIGLFAVSGLVGSVVGGALTDRMGRRSIILFGLLFSALGSVVMGLQDNLSAFYALAVVVGFLGNIASPAHQAMVADMLPDEQRSEGFGVLRVAANLAWVVGPTIGGLLATRSYLLLFLADAVASTITGFIVYRLIPETRPAPSANDDANSESILATLAGYGIVARDKLFIAYLVVSMLMLLVYQQMYNTLAVYLRDVHGVPDRGYGLLLSLDALTVVLLQFWVTRRIKGRPAMLMMAFGTFLYLVGFTLFGFVASYALFVAAILIITFGEMIVMPVGAMLAARFAPAELRGRYMAFHDLAHAIPSTVGAAAAGLILDNYDPNWVWYAAGIVSAVAVIGYLWLHRLTQRRFEPIEDDL